MTEHKKFEEIKYRAIFIHVDLPGQEDNAKDFSRYVLLQSKLCCKCIKSYKNLCSLVSIIGLNLLEVLKEKKKTILAFLHRSRQFILCNDNISKQK